MIRVPAWSGSSSGTFHGLHRAFFLLYPQMTEKGRTLVSSSPYKGIHPLHVNSTLMTSSKPNYLQITVGIRALLYEFWETQIFSL